ncbi:hypothetical protein QVD17_38577 [Tagetes erecta]|uniref:Uncharacterized protein n=1 Tax=Tagetes erecta TaxID=13708 RepID=A0AAD8NFH5_TARER|nr:hypothetical protein QVD17_38577 [Tagetes erecta]
MMVDAFQLGVPLSKKYTPIRKEKVGDLIAPLRFSSHYLRSGDKVLSCGRALPHISLPCQNTESKRE